MSQVNDRPASLPARTAAVAVGEERWVVYGRRGLYAFDVPHPTRPSARPSAEPDSWQRPTVAVDEAGLRPVTGPVAPPPRSAYPLGHWLSEPVVLDGSPAGSSTSPVPDRPGACWAVACRAS